MGKTKKHTLPIAPWVFIHDPTPDALFVSKLTQLIPRTTHVSLDRNITQCQEDWAKLAKIYKASAYRDTVIIFSDSCDHGEDGIKKVTSLRTAAIDNSCNFASINLHRDSKDEKKQTWGTNHLDIKLKDSSHDVHDSEVRTVADKVYQWLCK